MRDCCHRDSERFPKVTGFVSPLFRRGFRGGQKAGKQKNHNSSTRGGKICKFGKNKSCMLQLAGTYYKGKVHLEKIIPTDRPLKVVVVFEEDFKPESARLKLSDFSFEKSRQLLKDVKGSFGDTVIDERRDAL